MRIDVYWHDDNDISERLCRIEEMLGNLMENNMASLDDIKATLGVIDSGITAVKTDVETLLAKVAAIPVTGLTAEQQAAIDDIAVHVQGIATSLGAIDAEVNPPAPTA